MEEKDPLFKITELQNSLVLKAVQPSNNISLSSDYIASRCSIKCTAYILHPGCPFVLFSGFLERLVTLLIWCLCVLFQALEEEFARQLRDQDRFYSGILDKDAPNGPGSIDSGSHKSSRLSTVMWQQSHDRFSLGLTRVFVISDWKQAFQCSANIMCFLPFYGHGWRSSNMLAHYTSGVHQMGSLSIVGPSSICGATSQHQTFVTGFVY